MPAKKKTAKKRVSKKKVAVGVGAGIALAAAAAAIYAFSGEKGKKRRAKVAKWASSMKKEAIHELKAAKGMSKKAYSKIIDELGEKYSSLKDVNARDVAHLAKELKGHWDSIHGASKEVAKTAKKTTKKKARKSTKKK